MKKNKPPAVNGNSKISDFFAKSQVEKRKLPETETGRASSTVLQNKNGQQPPATSPGAKRFKENARAAPKRPRTPEKCAPSLSGPTTPRSARKKSPRSATTPKQLFRRSPRKVAEFNVHVLENFVRITPSKSTKLHGRETTPNKINNLQTSIVQYLSPSSSSSDSKRQPNEITPSKRSVPSCGKSPGCSVRTKLDFAMEIADMKIKDEPDSIKHENNDEINGLFDAFNDADFELQEVNSLDLDNPTRCTIIQVTKFNNSVVLRLKLKEKASNCSIEEFWAHTEFAENKKVFIKANKTKDDTWFINNANGWLVYDPDLLISCTTLVGSLFCKRKSILADRYPSTYSTNRAMLIGNLVHKLLQITLQKKHSTLKEIEQTLTQILSYNSVVHQLYATNLTLTDIDSEIRSFIPKVYDFVQQYVKRVDVPKSTNWQGKIQTIEDIEDNFWCPELGLKGKIDVTLKSNDNIMPLELKTGRASMSLEHRAQVVLYIMMMNKLGYKISTGLLLYLREGVVKDIPLSQREERDIIILRNDLTYYLTQKVDTSGQKLQTPLLPAPINHRACNNCEVKTICASFLSHAKTELPNGHQMKDVQVNATSHLSPAHISYFIEWSNLLHLELDSNKNRKALNEIYTISAIDREKKGRCLAACHLKLVATLKNDIFEHTFAKIDSANFPQCGFAEGNYIIISTDSRMAIATGFVRQITSNSIVINLDRNLSIKYKGKTFNLDTYDSQSAYLFNFTNLGLLLDDTPRAEQLRRIVVDKVAPAFNAKLPAVLAKRGKSIFKRLNRVQQRAALIALSIRDFVLIRGMPGTGKTSTIVALIQLYLLLEKSVLITSHTHAAIDNVCLRLKSANVEFIRLGNEGKIHGDLIENGEAFLTKNCDSTEKLDEVYSRFKVVGVTCLGSGHPMVANRTFDVCIIDESTQALQPSVLRPLMHAKTFILIGDTNQMAPVVRNQEALVAGLGVSLFECLEKAHPTASVVLTLNYRMNAQITKLANDVTYNGQLQPANETVANATLNLPNFDSNRYKTWILNALKMELNASVQFIDTGPIWKLNQTPKWYEKRANFSTDLVNPYEIAIVCVLVDALIEFGVDCGEIGVMATYSAQVAELQSFLKKYKVAVNTVDQFQGQDKSVIIYSCTKSKDLGWRLDNLQFDILEDKRRLTVAITRSKHKLIIVGDSTTLLNYTTFSKLYENIPKTNIIAIDDQIHSEWGIYLSDLQK